MQVSDQIQAATTSARGKYRCPLNRRLGGLQRPSGLSWRGENPLLDSNTELPARTLLSIHYAILVRSKSGRQTVYITSQFCVTCIEFGSRLRGHYYWTSTLSLLHTELQSSTMREHGDSQANKRLC